MHDLTTRTVREIALAAPATTRVFEQFGIDYCCGGRRSLEDACEVAGVSAEDVRMSLDCVFDEDKGDLGHPESFGPTELVDHILANHHTFTAQELERLTPLMAKVVSRHGEHHPELVDLQKVFAALAGSLVPHMQKEENVLFPFIKELDAAVLAGLPAPVPHFGTVNDPIRMMMVEHETDGERLSQMREITDNYTLPEGACPSFTALYAGFVDLEQDLHRHIHLENNVLFPAAAELEAG